MYAIRTFAMLCGMLYVSSWVVGADLKARSRALYYRFPTFKMKRVGRNYSSGIMNFLTKRTQWLEPLLSTIHGFVNFLILVIPLKRP